jgi:hypothetical protein
LVLDIYLVTAMFPKGEVYGLTSTTRQKYSDSLGNQRTTFVSPFEWFSHSLVEVSNEG